jgi:diadenosine tetraphosphate (Ap4A) HIT family hydrolase
MSNATAVKFGYPRTLVAETELWWILLRPKQPTFGALVLICKEDATAFSQLSAAAFSDLQVAVGGIERLLGDVVAYQKINYLMLMMLDPAVHFHVVPRYEGVRTALGVDFPDAGWPGPPALGEAVDLSEAAIDDLTAQWRRLWDAP